MRRKRIYYFLIWLVLAILQVVVIDNLRINSAVPNLVTTALVIGLFMDLPTPSLLGGALLSGAMLDLYHSSRFGLISLTLVGLVLLLSVVKAKYVPSASLIFIVAGSALASFFYDISLSFLTHVLTFPLMTLIAANALYSCLLSGVLVGALSLSRGQVFQRDSIFKGRQV